MGKKKPEPRRGDFDIYLRSELTSTQLVIEYPDYYVEDYQLPMLRSNVVSSVLKVETTGVGATTLFCYDVSGMESFQKRFEREKLSLFELQTFLKQFLEMMENLKKYMLDINLLFLNPEYIFWKENVYYFCYLPVAGEPLLKQFHCLTEYFVKQIDYGDMECIFLAHKLNQVSMEEQYDIRSILREYEIEASERTKVSSRDEKEEKAEVRERLEKPPISRQERKEKFIYEDPESIKKRRGFRSLVEKLTDQLPRGIRKSRWGGWHDLLLESDRQDL